jgi:hypothetical protein
MTVAAIAYRDLSPVERQKFDAILGADLNANARVGGGNSRRNASMDVSAQAACRRMGIFTS